MSYSLTKELKGRALLMTERSCSANATMIEMRAHLSGDMPSSRLSCNEALLCVPLLLRRS